MPRAQIQPGTWGKFTTTARDDGRVTAVVRYRRFKGGPVRRAETVAATKAAAERVLRERLRELVVETTPRVEQAEAISLAAFTPTCTTPPSTASCSTRFDRGPT